MFKCEKKFEELEIQQKFLLTLVAKDQKSTL